MAAVTVGSDMAARGTPRLRRALARGREPTKAIERPPEAEYLCAMTYVDSSVLQGRRNGQIKLHGPEAFEGMRKAGQLTAEALDLLVPMVKPGVTTNALDKLVFDFARDHDAYPAPLDYRGYRKSICTSINHVVCHGIPDDKPLRDGDIVNIDVTLIVDGWHGDSSRMYLVGDAVAARPAADRSHL